MPDQADIIRKCFSKKVEDRREAAILLAYNFSNFSNDIEAWHALLRLIQDEDNYVRLRAAYSLGTAFNLIPSKEQAWNVLYRLTRDLNSFVRSVAAYSLGTAFNLIPDRELAWHVLHNLAMDKDENVRCGAANALGTAFSLIPDRDLAWQDLRKLTMDWNKYVRCGAANALGKSFSQIPNKASAWQELLRLTRDPLSSFVRMRAACALGMAFSQVPDKKQAWQDFHMLTLNKDNYVRRGVANALGMAFSQVPDKEQAWQDLLRLTLDEEIDVRMYAYHSLGRASVFKAAETDDMNTFKRELETAVIYFEKSSRDYAFGPSKFCYLFYRTYLAVTFQEEKEDEIRKYLVEAKETVEGSEGKDELIKMIENLARSLVESQRLKGRSVQEDAIDLKAYRWYCEKAAEKVAADDDKAPKVVELLRKYNPIIEERIHNTILEIHDNAREILKTTHGSGTEFEALGAEIGTAATALSAGNPVRMGWIISSITISLKTFCRLLPQEEKSRICELVEEIEHEVEIPEKLYKIDSTISLLSDLLSELYRVPLADVVILTVLPIEYKAISSQLSGLKPPPAMDSKPNIYAWKFGEVLCNKFEGTYRVGLGMIGRPGNIHSALAAKEAIQLWRPVYIFFCGIAGGLTNLHKTLPDLNLGDVVIGDIIYGYEYGKIDIEYEPRENLTCESDQGLLTSANAYAIEDDWRKRINVSPPFECMPRVISGAIASGEKLVDNPTNNFFVKISEKWPKIKALEMEGIGIASAIKQSSSLHIPIGFMVIRGISDRPRPRNGDDVRGTTERDLWKEYAAATAAAFTIGWIGDGLPMPPFA